MDELREAPHDEAGYYTCECGKDRRGQPYNRRSVMHAHEPVDQEATDWAREQIAAGLRYIQRRYGTA
jgi:hypothetical protein